MILMGEETVEGENSNFSPIPRTAVFFLASILLSSSLACAQLRDSQRLPLTISRSWPVMGTFAEVRLVAADAEKGEAAIEAVRQVFDRVDRTMSVYRSSSDITRVNFAAGKESVVVDPWLAEVVEKAKQGWSVTRGAFSLNVLRAGIRLGLKPAEAMPPESPGEELSIFGDDLIEVSTKPPTVFLPRPGMGIDVGGIAKGFALDRAAQELRSRGFRAYLIDLGRSVIAGDAPPGEPGWTVMIEGENSPREISQISISVSRQGVFSDTPHIVNPSTGDPVPSTRWIAVSASDAWVADMASTALLVDPSLADTLSLRYGIRILEDETLLPVFLPSCSPIEDRIIF